MLRYTALEPNLILITLAFFFLSVLVCIVYSSITGFSEVE